MQINEFVEATHDIEQFYDKELKEFERKQWYEELKNMNTQRYRQIIREVYKKCKFMPKLADIISLNEELSYSVKPQQRIEKVQCDKCNSTGVIFYKKRIEGRDYEYVARCECQNGLEFAYDGTKISDTKNRSYYYVPTLAQLNLKGA